jgi:acetyltransferase-like isoleucine patch superfamily enzyme
MSVFSKSLRKTVAWLGRSIRSIRIVYLRATGAVIGSNTMISLGAKIDVTRGKVIIGRNCVITHGCVVLSHDYAATHILHVPGTERPTVRIEDGVFIGVNSVIMPDVTIGRNSIIGAGSIVTRHIPPGVIAAGNPARIIRQIPEHEKQMV